ncbi:MAG: YraN family protein [Hyphomicrobiaceae bacterium]
MSERSQRSASRTSLDERRARLGRGGRGELLAAALLLAKGYRILARRHRTPYGEVDIIAVRRGPSGRVAFVEVKRRPTFADAEAGLTPHQARRIADAADYWLARSPRYQDREVGLDAILVVPWRLPRHIPNALDRF